MFRLSRFARASVQVAARLTSDADERDDEHQPAADDGRIEQPPNRLVGDERGEDEQRHAVGLRREDLDAPEAECHRAARRPRRQRDRHQREADRGRVGEHVRGVGEQRERVRDDADADLDGHERDDQPEREREPARSASARTVVAGARRDACPRSAPSRSRYAAAGAVGRAVALVAAIRCGEHGD